MCIRDSNTNNPIIIKVSGGSQTPDANDDYYTFTDASNNPISIDNSSFRFMRGVTYRFSIDSTTNSNHPFEIYYKSGSNNTLTKATKSGNIIDVTIPYDQTVVAGDLYYICTSHDMSGNLGLLYKSLTGVTAPGDYDFFYGNITVQVSGAFVKDPALNNNIDEISVYCFYHQYMGGEQKLVYNDSCPTPS